MKYIIIIISFMLCSSSNNITFFRSETQEVRTNSSPAFRSNLFVLPNGFQPIETKRISAPIGAILPTSLPRKNVSKSANQSNQNLTNQVKKIFHQNLDQFLNTVQQLSKILNQTNNQLQIQQAVRDCRTAFKTINFFVDYFDSETIKQYFNGAPLPKLESNVPEVHVLAPEGLQVLDELVYIDGNFPLNEVKSLSQKLLTQTRKMVSYQKAISIEHRHLFEALRQEIIRVFTLYLTGFDTPGSANGINESVFSLSACFQTLAVYQNMIQQKKPGYWNNLSKLYNEAINYLQINNNFETFDHLYFYKTFLQPIYQTLYKIQVQLGIETIDEVNKLAQPINYHSTQLFNSGFFNPSYYAQINPKEQSKERAELGKFLFFDPRLSISGKMSCATCHQPEKAFTNGKVVNTVNSKLGSINRNVPTVINSVLADRYFYDLRSEKLSQQIEHVVVNNAEFHTNFIQISNRLKQIPAYAELFNKAYPNVRINQHSITNAVSNYLVELTTFNSPFDQYVRGEQKNIDEMVIQGFNLFMGKAACATCHFPPSFGGIVPPFYVESESEVLGVTVAPDQAILDHDLGRFTNGIIKEKAEHLKYAFKTTTVRNVALTAPYMHNGAYPTLKEVVNFYNHGGANGLGLKLPNQTLPPDSLHLTETEKKALIKFMKALTDTTGITNYPKVLPGGLMLEQY